MFRKRSLTEAIFAPSKHLAAPRCVGLEFLLRCRDFGPLVARTPPIYIGYSVLLVAFAIRYRVSGVEIARFVAWIIVLLAGGFLRHYNSPLL
ncbi:hypothetical protein GCM10007989_37960 [Devosia pacifica]|uniref:Uncharacterized protein n=1 Tax=Devosia pacifica TaxID=1335967 RepID=A0A918SF16_9HYPH|nr:hypothetical protein GCM10007989_37960 [Devosia pacifica]